MYYSYDNIKKFEFIATSKVPVIKIKTITSGKSAPIRNENQDFADTCFILNGNIIDKAILLNSI